MTNPVEVVRNLMQTEASNTLFRAVVIGLSDGQATIRRDGSDITEGPYPTIDTVVISVSDEVLVARVGTGYVVVGRIRRDGLPAAVTDFVRTGDIPGGELGGTYGVPTVDSVHSGSAHFIPGSAIQALSTGLLTTSYTDFLTFALGTGTWAIIVTAWGDNGGGLMTLALRTNVPTVLVTSQWAAGNPPTGSSTLMNIVTHVGSTTFRVSALTVTGGGTFRGGYMLAFKVAN